MQQQHSSQDSKFAYVPNLDDDTISAYSIDNSTGALAGFPALPFRPGPSHSRRPPTLPGNFRLSLTAAGTVRFPCTPLTRPPELLPKSPGHRSPRPAFLTPLWSILRRDSFLWEISGRDLVFSLNSSTGALTAVAGSPFQFDILTALAEDPAGKYLYAIVPAPSNFDDGSVLAFSIDGSSGNLTPVNGSFTTGEVPVAASVNPAGTLLYVANSDSNDVSGFTITPASGALTPVTGSPFSTGASEDAHSVTIDPSGAFVYVANEATQHVTVFGVNGTTGVLMPV